MQLMNLLFGTATVISAAKCGAENVQCKKDVQHLPNGVPYYYDRQGRRFLLDGRQIFGTGDDVKDAKGRVIWSRTDQWNTEAANKIPAGQYRYCAQYCDRSINPVTTNLDTGERIAQIERKIKNGKTECRKWRWYDIYRDIYPGRDLTYVCKTRPNATEDGDPGIVISEEEFEAIKKCPGARGSITYHDCWDDEEYYRTHRR